MLFFIFPTPQKTFYNQALSRFRMLINDDSKHTPVCIRPKLPCAATNHLPSNQHQTQESQIARETRLIRIRILGKYVISQRIWPLSALQLRGGNPDLSHIQSIQSFRSNDHPLANSLHLCLICFLCSNAKYGSIAKSQPMMLRKCIQSRIEVSIQFFIQVI